MATLPTMERGGGNAEIVQRIISMIGAGFAAESHLIASMRVWRALSDSWRVD